MFGIPKGRSVKLVIEKAINVTDQSDLILVQVFQDRRCYDVVVKLPEASYVAREYELDRIMSLYGQLVDGLSTMSIDHLMFGHTPAFK